MYKLDDIIEYLLYNNLLNNKLEIIDSFHVYTKTIHVMYYIPYGIIKVSGTKFIIIEDFNSYLIKRRFEKIKKIKNKISMF